MKIASFTMLSGLVGTTNSYAETQKRSVKRHGSSKRGFYANSYLFEGDRECVLIDAHLNRDEAMAVSAMISETGKPLSAIVITHPHPDHYLGLEHIAPIHPNAIIYSSSEALDVVRISSADWRGFNNILRALNVGPITLAGHRFECILPPDAESLAPVVLYERESRTLIAGDHVLNGQHLWLVEGRGNAWKQNLEFISNRWPIDLVLPGHGEIGGSELVDQTHAYLASFLSLMERRLSAEQAKQEMLTRYPTHVFPEALDNSILANF